MSIRKANGGLQTNKGDSFSLPFNIKGLNPVTLYCIYLSLNFPEPVIKSKEVTTDQQGSCRVVFEVCCQETEVFPKKYTYGVKTCRGDNEDTIHTGTIEIQDKYVEGN